MRPLFSLLSVRSTAPGTVDTARPDGSGHRFRPEVQGLRAVAVLLVVVYHLNPDLMPGGYVGVDVFFVISGFLITSLLYREASGRGRVLLGRFYVRRVRRLLPAATVVLVAVGAVSLVFLPATQLAETAWQLLASALYSENLYLAHQAVDYLAADTPPSPVQHFWSLAVEEQFYLLWPLPFMLWALAVRRWRATPRLLVVALSGLLIVSLVHSVVWTVKDPTAAYFLPTTRAWELAVGGLLALIPAQVRIPRWVRAPLCWVGLVAIVASALLFDDATAFPGWQALLPVLGAAAVIAGEGAATPLDRRPAQFVGDISYSLYLWHWPLIVFASVRVGGAALGPLSAVAVLSASFLLAWLTKVWVEDPVRERELVRTGRAALVTALAGIVLVAAVSGAALARVGRYSSMPFDPRVHVGPEALDPGHASPSADPYPTLVEAVDDLPVVYDDECQADRQDTVPDLSCVYGDPDGEHTVVLLGDSHAAQWFPALQEISRARGWRLVVLTKSACAFTATSVLWTGGEPYPECAEWNGALLAALAELEPELALVSSSVRTTPASPGGDPRRVLVEGLVEQWSRAVPHVDRFLVLQDTPLMPEDLHTCLESSGVEPVGCGVSRSQAFDRDDPQVFAANTLDDTVQLLDMSDRFCAEGVCSPVIGNVVVYRDSHHMTASYAQLLAEELEERIDGPTH